MTIRRVLLALAALTLAARCRQSAAATVLAHGTTVPPPAGLAEDVRRMARVGMDRAVVFNRQPGKGEIALVLAAPSADWEALTRRNGALQNVRNNCYATPRARSVVCDAAVFSRVNALVGGTANAEQRTAYARWIVGHELGHLATAASGLAHAMPHESRPKRDVKQQRREYAADCWMMQTFARTASYDEQIALERFAMDTINAHFRQREPDRPSGAGLIFDYNSLDPYDFVSGTTTHPDTVLRSIRLLHVAAEQRQDAGLRAMITPLVRRLVPDPLWNERGPCGPRS